MGTQQALRRVYRTKQIREGVVLTSPHTTGGRSSCKPLPGSAATSSIVCHCKRCREDITSEQWDSMKLIGIQHFDDGEPDYELRNHRCGCTYSREVNHV
jgi:hypothetical protein